MFCFINFMFIHQNVFQANFLILVYCNQQDQLLPKIHKNVKNDKTISLFNLIDNLIVKHYIQSVREGPICFRGFIFHIIH